MVKNWLITGGCGFIGSALVGKLVEIDPAVNIRILDNLAVGSQEDLGAVCGFKLVNVGGIERGPDGIELVIGDIRDQKAGFIAATGVDVVVHLAANTGVGPSVDDPRADCEMNVTGTLNMLEAARHQKVVKFVFASSGAPVGNLDNPPIHEELPAHPVSPYGASKLAGEGYCSAYYQTFGIDTVALRFGNVYGPGSKHKGSLVAKFIKEALNGDRWEIYGDGSQTRDFIFIDDIVDALVLAGEKLGVGGEIFQIATNKETTVGEIAASLADVLSKNGVKIGRIVNGAPRLGDVKRNFSDTTKARKRLGWVAGTSLTTGLEKTVRSFL